MSISMSIDPLVIKWDDAVGGVFAGFRRVRRYNDNMRVGVKFQGFDEVSETLLGEYTAPRAV